MKVLVTGGAGFLGRRLADKLLAVGRLTGPDGKPAEIEQLTLLDVVPAEGFSDPRVRVLAGDITDSGVVGAALDAETGAVFHLAAIVSGQAEADFDLGWRINLDGSRLLLETCRALGHRPKVVLTSSVAVFGGALPAVLPEGFAVKPQSSYGAQKAIGELLLGDYSRKGFVDGRVLRLPTISVRPGRPNKAASSFASGIIREPLNGEMAVCPVPPATRLWLLSPRKAIEALISVHEIDAARLGGDRTVNLPGVSVTAEEMATTLGRVAGAEVAGRIVWQEDPAVTAIVGSWPGAWEVARAAALGLQGDADFEAIVRAYIEDDLPKRS